MRIPQSPSAARVWRRLPVYRFLALGVFLAALLFSILFVLIVPATAAEQMHASDQDLPEPAQLERAGANLLFADDFDDGNADGWTTSGLGTWSVENNEYVVDMPDGVFEKGGYAVAGDIGWTNYSLEVDVKGTAGYDKIIRARYQDPGTFYGVNLRSGFYNDLWLHRSIGGVEEVLATVPFSNSKNTWYHLSLIMEGPNIRVLVNGEVLIDHTETGVQWPTHGKIGLQGWNDATIHYDNVLVRRSPVALSTKSVSPPQAPPGEPVTYTIALVITDPISPTTVMVTDTLPVSLTYTPDSLSAPSGAYAYADGVITWTETVSSSTSITITFGATVSPSLERGRSVVNTVHIGAEDMITSRSATVKVPLVKVHLPLVQSPQHQP